MEFITPKTDWKPTDKFNISDFNRIKHNTEIVSMFLSATKGNIEYEEMGEDITSYVGYWNPEQFNAIEKNIGSIAVYTNGESPYSLTFRENSAFIKSDELNRIERITNYYQGKTRGWEVGRTRLPSIVGRDRRLGF